MASDSSFVKCVLSYPDATIALAQFRDVVQQRCITVLERSLDPLRNAVGYKGELSSPSRYSYPDRPTVNEENFFRVGAKAVHGNDVWFCAGLYWYLAVDRKSDYEVGLSVYAWFNNAKLRSRLVAEMKAAEEDRQRQESGWHLGDFGYPEFRKVLRKGQVRDFDLHLDRSSTT